VVVLAAVLFARRLPLSKPRVDLLYYSLAAMSATILYVDNADQRATVQVELDRQRLEFLRAAVKRQDSEVARLRASSERAAAELSEAESSLPSLQQELNAAKRVARTALDAIEKAHDERCIQVWRECPLIVTPHRARQHGKGREWWTPPGSIRLRSEKELLRAGGSEFRDVGPSEPAWLEQTG
jgi:hypothetical protein